MKSRIMLSGLFALSATVLMAQYNYELTINGEKIDINLDEARQYKTKKGETLSISLREKDVLTYKDEMITFSYYKGLSVSRTPLDEGIEQLAVMNASGSGFLIQKYTSMNPSGMVDLMMNELIKESINYGYQKTEEPFSHKLKSEQTISGKKVKLTYKDESEYYTVASFGEKDEGILVVMMITNDDFADQDQKMTKLLLESLALMK